MQEARPQDHAEGEELASRPRGWPWALLLLWVAFACLISGAVAEVLRLPPLWGAGNRFMEYGLPLPLTWGMLHWPSLGLFGLLLTVAHLDPGRWRGLVRLVFIGTLLAIAVALNLSEALRGFPVLVYAGVDAATALVASGLIRVPEHTPSWIWSPRARAAALLGPALLVAAALTLGPLVQPRYKIALSDTHDLGPDRDVLQFWAYSRRRAGDAADECRHLAALAETYRDRYPRADGERHRAILLFRDRDHLRQADAPDAWVSYEWWPDGREVCSADPTFQPDR